MLDVRPQQLKRMDHGSPERRGYADGPDIGANVEKNISRLDPAVYEFPVSVIATSSRKGLVLDIRIVVINTKFIASSIRQDQ